MFRVTCCMAKIEIQKYKITKRIQETHNVFLLNLVPEKGEVFDFLPGQFVMFHIYNQDGTVWKKMPYSLCTPPETKDHIQLGIKVYGEFTQRTSELKEGDVVGISGPFGRFIFREEEMKNVMMLAGGIGITPFLCSIRHATVRLLSNKITLIYANHALHDIAFRNEFQILDTKNKNFNIIYALDHPPAGWRGQTGYVTQEMIEQNCSDLQNTYFFLCGPPSFMDAILKHLAELGVENEKIKIEKF